MTTTRLSLTFGILSLLVVGCTESSTAPDGDLPPDDFELPEADPSLDPSDLVVGDYIATPCMFSRGGAEAFVGQEQWATVDIFFGRATESGPWNGPTSEDSLLVSKHDGRILFSFHVPAVRARMVLSHIPGLVLDGHWVTVRKVPDATRYDFPVSVGFSASMTDEHVSHFQELGGRVDYRHDFIDALAGPIPNQSVPVLRARPDIAWLQPSGIACLT